MWIDVDSEFYCGHCVVLANNMDQYRTCNAYCNLFCLSLKLQIEIKDYMELLGFFFKKQRVCILASAQQSIINTLHRLPEGRVCNSVFHPFCPSLLHLRCFIHLPHLRRFIPAFSRVASMWAINGINIRFLTFTYISLKSGYQTACT